MSKLPLILSLVLGIGVGVLVPSAIAIFRGHLSGFGGHATSGHGIANHLNSKSEPGARVQISRTATVTTPYPVSQATHLFSAKGEIYWLGDIGWNPEILSGDGYGRGDVFTLFDNTFMTLAFDADAGISQLARVEAGVSAGLVEIEITPIAAGSIARVTYTLTSLSNAGDEKLAAVTDEAFASQMTSWQTAIEANDTQIREWLGSRTH